ncbi:MAG: HAD family phosphatase [Bacteroidota bacterium]|nr:HAD family phosphatase [Bacteroidota bacterium]
MSNIKNIIFDLGGVFMNLDYRKMEQSFIDLGITNFSELFTQHHSSPLFEDLETGKISNEEFYAGLRKIAQVNLSDSQIRDAWNAVLLDFPAERIDWLVEIKKKYNIYLFSNTNQIHYDAFMEIFKAQTGKHDFNQYFIKAYYSQELGLRKPYKESYQKIIDEQKLIPAETLFIDDTLKNIEGAKQVGLQTFHLAPPMTVLDLKL